MDPSSFRPSRCTDMYGLDLDKEVALAAMGGLEESKDVDDYEDEESDEADAVIEFEPAPPTTGNVFQEAFSDRFTAFASPFLRRIDPRHLSRIDPLRDIHNQPVAPTPTPTIIDPLQRTGTPHNVPQGPPQPLPQACAAPAPQPSPRQPQARAASVPQPRRNQPTVSTFPGGLSGMFGAARTARTIPIGTTTARPTPANPPIQPARRPQNVQLQPADIQLQGDTIKFVAQPILPVSITCLFKKEDRVQLQADERRDIVEDAIKKVLPKFKPQAINFTDSKENKDNSLLENEANLSSLIASVYDRHKNYNIHTVFTIVFPVDPTCSPDLKMDGNTPLTLDLYHQYTSVTVSARIAYGLTALGHSVIGRTVLTALSTMTATSSFYVPGCIYGPQCSDLRDWHHMWSAKFILYPASIHRQLNKLFGAFDRYCNLDSNRAHRMK